LLETLITSKTRVKLLLKFFINPEAASYLRGLETEIGESSNAIRIELNRFEKAGMIKSYEEGNKKMFKANASHPLFKEVTALVKKYIGIDILIQNVINRLGDLQYVYLTGDLAKGLDSQIIDLIFVGKIDTTYLLSLTQKSEKLLHKKVRFLVYDSSEFSSLKLTPEENILLWQKDH
jgi:DNA-binding transcriptional ArsR family regulator